MMLVVGAGVADPAAGRARAERMPTREWTFDRRLTADPAESGLSFNFARSIAADETGALHVVWIDNRDGNPELYYKRRNR